MSTQKVHKAQLKYFSSEETGTELLPELDLSENVKELDTMHWNREGNCLRPSLLQRKAANGWDLYPRF